MKKKIVTAVRVGLAATTMTISAQACTPRFTPPKMPEIKIDTSAIKVSVFNDFWTKYFKEHPLPTLTPKADNNTNN